MFYLYCIDQVTATENPEHSTSITIRLVIENENDNIPKFEKDHYEAHVLENAPEGTTITTMTVRVQCYLILVLMLLQSLLK